MRWLRNFGTGTKPQTPSIFYIHPLTASFSHEHLQYFENVISEDQEKTLVSFVDAIVKRKRYDKNHFDDVILNYRETEIYQEKLEGFQVTEVCVCVCCMRVCVYMLHIYIYVCVSERASEGDLFAPV